MLNKANWLVALHVSQSVGLATWDKVWRELFNSLEGHKDMKRTSAMNIYTFQPLDLGLFTGGTSG